MNYTFRRKDFCNSIRSSVNILLDVVSLKYASNAHILFDVNASCQRARSFLISPLAFAFTVRIPERNNFSQVVCTTKWMLLLKQRAFSSANNLVWRHSLHERNFSLNHLINSGNFPVPLPNSPFSLSNPKHIRETSKRFPSLINALKAREGKSFCIN